MNPIPLRPMFALSLLLLPPLLAAGEGESHDRIRAAARQHVQAQYGGSETGLKVQVGQLDRRLRLPPCAAPLETFSPGGRRKGAKQTVGVRCTAGQGWSLYVPVKVSIHKPVLVAAREISRGTPLTMSDFQLEDRDVAALHRGYLDQPARLIGKVLKRDLHAGAVITPAQLASRKVIRRGSQVTIVARVGSIKVRMAGKALGDAGIGERVRVQNSSSRRKIEATAVAPGIVEVAL